jgi:hypothetical protein
MRALKSRCNTISKVHLKISIASYKFPLVWPPLIAQVVSKALLITIVLYKLVLGSSKLLRGLLAVVIDLILHEVITVLLCLILFLI